MVVHELRWRDTLDQLVDFRRRMRTTFGLLMREEIHAGAMLAHPGGLVRIKRNDRLTIIRHLVDELAKMTFLNFINVRIDKEGKPEGYDPFAQAWQALIQRFENTLNYRNFPGPANPDDKGIIFCDETDDVSLRKLARKMNAFNPVPNRLATFGSGYRMMPLTRIVEDPSIRRSHHSYFIQAVDVAAFAMYQWYAPSTYIRNKGASGYFTRLDPILCKVASNAHPYGVVEL